MDLSDTSVRESVMFSLWTRPTIPFKLECESGTIKQDITSQISKVVEIMRGDNSEKIDLRHSGNIAFFGVLFVSNFVFGGIGLCI